MKPKWMEIAEKEIGQKEIRGEENPRIIEYHSTTTLKAKEDEVPWCSAFVNWCIVQAGIIGTNSAAAKSWLSWGEEIDVPVPGCICVIHKKVKGEDKNTGSSSGYHVAFYRREDANRIWLLGGNQGNQVKETSFSFLNYEVCGYRMPDNNV
jgi:uncharacterized protein (TIGR02594 family)